MASEDDLLPLQKTLDSVEAIQKCLVPFLHIIQEQKSRHGNCNEYVHSNDIPRHEKTEAQAAIALALGTMRYMNARLQGIDCSQPDHPLRMELDKMRRALVELRKVDPRPKENSSANVKSDSNSSTISDKNEMQSMGQSEKQADDGKVKREPEVSLKRAGSVDAQSRNSDNSNKKKRRR